MIDGDVLAFVGVAIVLTLSPGPDMALVLRNTLRGGRAAGYRTVAGVALGILGWATASALGVAAVLAASATVFTAEGRGRRLPRLPRPADVPRLAAAVHLPGRSRRRESALLAAIFVSIGLAWLCAYVLIVGAIARNRTFRRATEAVSGAVLVALGARLAIGR